MEEKEIKDQQLEQQESDEEKNKKVVVAPIGEKKRRSKKRLLFLLLLLLVTGLMLGTSTYAWFTSNRTVTVNDINVDVAASGGIQISVDGTSWKSVVSNADILGAIDTYAAATNQLPSTLRPVSTAANTLNNGYLSMWLGTVTSNAGGDYILTSEDVSTVADNSTSGANNGSNGHFVAFDLFLRLDDAGTEALPLYLTTSSNVAATADNADMGTKNASRVAFVVEGETDTGSDVATIQALTTTDISNVYVWEPNFDAHTTSGISNAFSFYNDIKNGDAYNKAQAGEQVPYFGTTGAVLESDNVMLSQANATDNGSKFAAVTPTHKTESDWAGGNDYLQLFNLSPNKITKVRVYFWVEGQDIDCENNASGGFITLSLQFSLNDKADSADAGV